MCLDNCFSHHMNQRSSLCVSLCCVCVCVAHHHSPVFLFLLLLLLAAHLLPIYNQPCSEYKPWLFIRSSPDCEFKFSVFYFAILIPAWSLPPPAAFSLHPSLLNRQLHLTSPPGPTFLTFLGRIKPFKPAHVFWHLGSSSLLKSSQ